MCGGWLTAEVTAVNYADFLTIQQKHKEGSKSSVPKNEVQGQI